MTMHSLRAFTMPKWGIEMVEGTVADWMVAEGEDFVKGQVLTLIETDKITNEVEAEFPARLVRIVLPAGETAPVGALLAVFSDGQTDPAAIESFLADYGLSGDRKAPDPAAAPATIPAAAASPDISAAPSSIIADGVAISAAARAHAAQNRVDVAALTGSGREGRITFQDVDQAMKPSVAVGGAAVSIMPVSNAMDRHFASPLAKRLALQHRIDLDQVTGSGPRGRIGKGDVLRQVQPVASPPVAVATASPPPAPAPGVSVVRMSPMRKAIAKQLTLSKTTIPHFYLRNIARIDALQALRDQARQATGAAPSINDYLLRACALALRIHPDVNVQVHGEEIHRFDSADIAVAVATDKGLLTPIIRAAETKSVAQISSEVKLLAQRARDGRLNADEFQGGSFSLSNLGMFGIDQFDAIINPPQAAILAVGASRQETIGINHALAFATQIKLSLSCDHRAIDGAVGARFLAELTTLIEQPAELRR